MSEILFFPQEHKIHYIDILITEFLMIFQKDIFQNFQKVTEDFQRFPKITEDFQGRAEDVSIIHW